MELNKLVLRAYFFSDLDQNIKLIRKYWEGDLSDHVNTLTRVKNDSIEA